VLHGGLQQGADMTRIITCGCHRGGRRGRRRQVQMMLPS
jgi:hypothetical protein